MQTPAPREEASGRFDSGYANRMLVLFSGVTGVTLYIEGMLFPSLPSISSDFGVTVATVSLVLAVYAVSGCALAPLMGKLGDIYGKKRILNWVLVLYAAAVTVTGFSPSFAFLLVARAVQGIGIAIQPLLISMVREEFPREKVPRAQGILNGMYGIGFALSLPVGGLVSNAYGWRGTYHTAIPFAILFALLTFVMVRESRYKKENVKADFGGAVLLGLPLAFIVLALGEGSSWGWTSIWTASLLVLGLAIFVPLFFYERSYLRRGGEPILNLRLLSMRNVVVANISNLLGALAMYLAFEAYIFKFESPSPVGFGLDIFAAGVSLVPLAVSIIIFSPLAGVVISKLGTRPITAAGAFIGMCGFYFNSQATTYNEELASMFVVGAGVSFVLICAVNLLVLTVELPDMGLATSMTTVFKNLGGSLGAPIAGSILSTFTIAVAVGSVAGKTIYASLPSSTAFQYSFDAGLAMLAVVAFVAPFAREVIVRGQKVDLGARMRGEEA